MTTTDTRPYTTSFTVSREAMDVIAAASEHCDRLAQYYGRTSEEYLNAVESWQRQVSRMFARPLGADVHVVKDMADRSLYVNALSSGFVYGLIWHGVKRHCTNEGCKAYINDDDSVWTYNRDDHKCDKHTPSYPLDWPQPGDWSFHS